MKKRIFIFMAFSLQLLARNDLSHLWLNFNTSMEHSRSYQETFANQDPFWQQVQALYDQHIIKNLELSKEPRIPKIIHQIWIGSPLPEQYKKLQKTWKKHHPDWQYILWTDKEIRKLNLFNMDKYNFAINYGEKSDIARFELLYRFGGVYVDTDFECLQPFDILHHACDFYTSVAYDKECLMYSAVIACKPGHPIIKKCIEDLRLITSNTNDPHQILERTGPFYLTRCIKQSLPSITDRSVIFPITYFYPWPGEYRFQNSRAEIKRWFKPESFAVHHWNCSWMKSR